jgi:hypothetical protein
MGYGGATVEFDRSGGPCQVVGGEHAYGVVLVVDNDGDASALTYGQGDLGQQGVPSYNKRLRAAGTNDVAYACLGPAPDRDPLEITERESTGSLPPEVHQREGLPRCVIG